MSPAEHLAALLATAQAHAKRLEVIKSDSARRAAARKKLADENARDARAKFDAMVAEKVASGEGFSQNDMTMVGDSMRAWDTSNPRPPMTPVSANLDIPNLIGVLGELPSVFERIDRSLDQHAADVVAYERACEDHARKLQEQADAEEEARVLEALKKQDEHEALLAKARATGLVKPAKKAASR